MVVPRQEDGFSLIEVMIAIFVFSIFSVAMYQVLFASARGSDQARSLVDVSEEARLGLNRMVRDTREGDAILLPTSASYRVETDFDADGVIEPNPLDPVGNYESLTFSFVESSTGNGRITVSNGTSTEPLVRGVDCIRKADATCNPVFSFTSSRLEYDTNQNGITSEAELMAAPGLGNGNSILDGQEVNFVDGVSFALTITTNETSRNFYAEAQLRNRR